MNLLLADVREDYTSLVPARDPKPTPKAHSAETDKVKKEYADGSRDEPKLGVERGSRGDGDNSGSDVEQRMAVESPDEFGTRHGGSRTVRDVIRLGARSDKNETEEGGMGRGEAGLSGGTRGVRESPHAWQVGGKGESDRGTRGKGVAVKQRDTVGGRARKVEGDGVAGADGGRAIAAAGGCGDVAKVEACRKPRSGSTGNSSRAHEDETGSSVTGGSDNGNVRFDPTRNVARSGEGGDREGEEEEDVQRSKSKSGRRRSRHKGPWRGELVPVRRQRFLKQLLIRGDNVVMIWEAPRF